MVGMGKRDMGGGGEEKDTGRCWEGEEPLGEGGRDRYW